jgi:histidinol dehydrogenase
MRLLRGLQEARKFVAERGPMSESDVPEEMARRIEGIFNQPMTPGALVARILKDVKAQGDTAVRDFSHRIDGVHTEAFEVSKKQIQEASKNVSQELYAALELAAMRVRDFAATALPTTWHNSDTGLGERIVPIDRVGIYTPGGSAAYPSSVIMVAVTARAAGVKELILCTPPRSNGSFDPAVAAAILIAGVERVFCIGGAQAIAAMAFGTNSVPRVDKVCGPGNIFVTLAKQQLYGQVGIDGLFGPTDTLAVADDSTDPVLCAADLLAQAEHDVLATPVLVTPSERFLQQVDDEIEQQLQGLERQEIARAALRGQGTKVLVGDLDEAMKVANIFAPEHLCLMVNDPWRLVDKVANAGTVFVGQYSPEVLGDFVAGPSHTIPTEGTARFSSYLGVNQFLKRIPVVALQHNLVKQLAIPAATIARAEGFTGHARAAELRLDSQSQGKV